MTETSAEELSKKRIENIQKHLTKIYGDEAKRDIFKTNKLVDADILQLMKEAESGDHFAMMDLAIAFANGYGVQKNYDKAFNYAESALNHIENSDPNYIGNKAIILSFRCWASSYIEDKPSDLKLFTDYLKFVVENQHPFEWDWDIIRKYDKYYLQFSNETLEDVLEFEKKITN